MTLLKLIICFDEHLDYLASDKVNQLGKFTYRYNSFEKISCNLYNQKELLSLLTGGSYELM